MENPLSRREFLINSALIAGAGIIAPGGLNKMFDRPGESKIKITGLKELRVFDSCITFGRCNYEISIKSAEQLLSIMDRYYIEEALVHDYHARVLYPIEDGNRRLLDMIRNCPRLHPVWILEPPLQPGRILPDRLVDEMLASGVRVARLHLPAKGVLAWVWEDLFAALEAHRIPCFLDFGTDESTLGSLTDNDLEVLHDLVQQHPQLPLILSHVMGGLGVNPGALYLIHRSKNLYLDITGILEYWRKIAYEVGPDRVLFATGMPFTDPGILVSNVQYALGLDEKAKKMICGDNLRRLIGGVI